MNQFVSGASVRHRQNAAVMPTNPSGCSNRTNVADDGVGKAACKVNCADSTCSQGITKMASGQQAHQGVALIN